jgi:hypothetical protein
LEVGDEERAILDCYWLAEIYHQNPEVFLNMPMSDVRLHIARTVQLKQQQQQADGN